MAAPQNFSHHQHNMPSQHQTMSYDGSGGMQSSMMWNVDPSVRHPGEKPKRPLSAYNFFFQLERERIINGDIKDKDVIGEYTLEDVARVALIQQKKAKENKPKEKRSHRKTHGKISFGDLARTIANKWKKLDEKTKAIFEGSASIEKERYKKELTEWTKQQKKWKDATTQMSTMGMMFPGANAGGFNIVTPTQMPKQTVLGAMGGIPEATSANDAMAIAIMNQRLMNDYSERSATSVRSHPGMMMASSQPNPTPSSESAMSSGRRASTGGMSSSMAAHGQQQQQQQQQQQRQQQQHRYGMDFFDYGGDDMHGSGIMEMRDISYQRVADETFNHASSTLSSPTSSPNDFHNRAIISQQRQMQIMLMQRQQKMMQQRHHQQQQQQEPSSAAMMQQMMLMKQYGSNNNLIGMSSGCRQEHHDNFLNDDHHASTFHDDDKNDMDGSNNSSNRKNSSPFAGHSHHHQV